MCPPKCACEFVEKALAVINLKGLKDTLHLVRSLHSDPKLFNLGTLIENVLKLIILLLVVPIVRSLKTTTIHQYR